MKKSSKSTVLLFLSFIMHTKGISFLLNYVYVFSFYLASILIYNFITGMVGEISLFFLYFAIIFILSTISHVYFLLSLINTSTFFSQLSNRWNCSQYLIIGVSQHKKFVLSFLISILMQFIMYFLFTMLTHRLSIWLISSNPTLIEEITKNFNAVFLFQAPPFLFLSTLVTFLFYNSLFFFGSLYFRSVHFVKTVAMFLAISLFVSLFIPLYIKLNLEQYLEREMFTVLSQSILFVVLMFLSYRLFLKYSMARVTK